MIEDDDSDSDWNSTESDDSESNTSNSYIEEINWLTFFEVAFHPCSHSRGRELETSDIINDAEAIKPRISWLKLDLILPDAPKTIWKEMGATLSRIKRLEKLNFCGLAHEFTPTMVSEIFQADGPYQFPLKAMSLSHNAINSRHVEALLPFLESREELAMLNLENNDIDSEGARLLGEALQSIRIQSLFLSNNQMCAGWVSSILSSENSTHFVHLELGKNCIGLVDIEEIASFLRRENISLERISLGNDTDSDDGFDIEWLEILFESLKKNTITTEIHVQSLIRISDEIEADSYISLSDHISAACMKLVSNTSSFEAFCESNHFFHHLDTINVLDYDEQDEFDTLRLHQVSTLINQRTELSTNQKLRSKLRLIFFRDEFDIQPFLSMSPKAMPQVLEIVTRSEELITKDCYTPARFIKTLEGNLNAIYNFIRRWNVPVLFSYPFQVDEVEEMKSELARMQLESNLKLQQLRLEEGEKIKGLENAYRKLQSESEREMKILESEVRRLREENRCLELELQEIRLRGHNPHK